MTNSVKDETADRFRLPCILFLILLAVAGFAFRAPQLTKRPMHTDEAVHAYKLGELLDTGKYEYNRYEYHGPTAYYFAAPFVYLTGARSYSEIKDEWPLRIVPVLFGVGLILLLLLFRDAIGQRAAVVAALLTCLSPAMVYYSRYYIQEMLLVFFTFGAIVAGWRYTRAKKIGWALAAGACLGFMHATKETCVIAYASMAGALLLTILWTRWIDKQRIQPTDYFHNWHMVGALKIGLVISILCLTALLSNPKATIDSVATYGDYLKRGGTGSGSTNGFGIHNHPWYYYLQILVYYRDAETGFWWSEGLIVVLALVGIVKALMRKVTTEANFYLLRFLAFYTILMTGAYALIPYKTPWCLLGFFHGMILMAGVGAIAIYRRLPDWVDRAQKTAAFLLLWLWRHKSRTIAICLFAAASAHLGSQAYRASFQFPADTRNPYVYAHTSPMHLKLVEKLEEFARVHPLGHDMPILLLVDGSGSWPLPWYTRQFKYVGAAEDIATFDRNLDILKEAGLKPAVIISVEKFQKELSERLGDDYFIEFAALRPGVWLDAYIESSLWEKFIESRSKPAPQKSEKSK